jgi:WD40 repeat protein
VAAGDQDGVVHLWSARAGTVRAAARHDGWINAVAIAGGLLFTLGDDGLLRRITVAGARSGQDIPIEVGWSAATALAVSADAALVAAAGSEGVVRLWRGTTGEDAGTVEVGAAVSALAIDPDGRSLAVGTLDGTLRLYSLTDRALRGEAPGTGGPIRAVLAAPRHGWAAAGDDSGAVRLWSMHAGGITGAGAVLGLHGGPVRGIGALAGGEPASADADGIVRVWSERRPTGWRRDENTEAR